MIKRLTDVAVSVAALAVLWPLFVAVAVAIRRDSPGPVFYRQLRVGRGGAPFRIHKFRTMADGPPASGLALTVGHDPRITRTGAWLRRTRVDELPQFIDVLRGAMSLVGPRPEVPRYVDHYPAALRAQVLSVRPGITDPASLAYRHEAELLAQVADPERHYIDVLLPAKLAVSAAYLARATWFSDLGVMWQTLRVLSGR